MIYQTSFGPINEFFSKSPQFARQHARENRALSSISSQIRPLFLPEKEEMKLGSIRLAIRMNNNWLFVDESGKSKFGGAFGRFDVLGWELLLRRYLPKGVRESQLVKIHFENRTAEAVKLIDGCGIPRGCLPASSSSDILTWFGPHSLIFIDHEIYSFDRFFTSTGHAPHYDVSMHSYPRGARDTKLLYGIKIVISPAQPLRPGNNKGGL